MNGREGKSFFSKIASHLLLIRISHQRGKRRNAELPSSSKQNLFPLSARACWGKNSVPKKAKKSQPDQLRKSLLPLWSEAGVPLTERSSSRERGGWVVVPGRSASELGNPERWSWAGLRGRPAPSYAVKEALAQRAQLTPGDTGTCFGVGLQPWPFGFQSRTWFPSRRWFPGSPGSILKNTPFLTLPWPVLTSRHRPSSGTEA